MLRKELASLNPEEREVLQELLNEAGQQGPKLAEVIGQLEYKRTPVDITTFVKDPYYLGNTCDNIYPILMQDLVELFDHGPYREVIFSGSIGWGKTHLAAIGICRLLYELSCMRDPQKSFGLAADSNISIVVFSVNELLAQKVAFESILSKLKASPYFQENFSFEDTKKEIRFSNKIWLAPRASTDNSALGLNVVSFWLDESNFLPRTAKDIRMGIMDRAETIYTSMTRRMKSRFERNGRLPGMAFVVSSKKTQDDFTARRIKVSMSDPTIFVRDYALWETRPEEYYSSNKFLVLCGNETVPSRILSDEEYDRLKPSLPDDVVVVRVPEDFRNDFDRDLEGSIRDIAGVSTVAVNPFITRREKILSAVDSSRTHPFTTLILDPAKPGKFRWDLMVSSVQERGFAGEPVVVYRPKLHPRAIRMLHLDPSLRNDCTGICMAHIGEWKDVVRRADNGQEYLERAPVYFIDLLLKVVPPPGDEIVLADLRHMVYDLSAHGYIITGISMDSWQCFTGDTRIRLVDGRVLCFEELVSLYKPGEEFSVYSYFDGKAVLGRARNPRKSGRKEIVTVTMSKGYKNRCTPDHLWLLKDGTWKQAKDLKRNDVLMPMHSDTNRKVLWVEPAGEADVYDLTVEPHPIFCLDHGVFVHNSADSIQTFQQRGYNAKVISVDTTMDPYENLKMALYENRVNFYHYPAVIEELQQLEKRYSMDGKRVKVDHPPKGCFVGETLIPLADGSHSFIKDLVGKEVMVYASDCFGGQGKVVSAMARGRFTKEVNELVEIVLNDGWSAKCTPDHLWRLQDGSYREARELLAGEKILSLLTTNTVTLRQGCLEGSLCKKSASKRVNFIRTIQLELPLAVFDLEVDKYSNFCLDSGIFVHNSKDVADALAGACFNLSLNKSVQPLPVLKGLSYSGDAWMEEQRQSLAAGNELAGANSGMLPPILVGSGNQRRGGSEWDPEGGGWYPG